LTNEYTSPESGSYIVQRGWRRADLIHRPDQKLTSVLLSVLVLSFCAFFAEQF